ncbi:hypothetical protein BJ165DRAFT_769856 [Panaeolus papilionaceus]|nr:hypothetical protein BJ165DRAFT_769856 [Panaeolus papilionaceus]
MTRKKMRGMRVSDKAISARCCTGHHLLLARSHFHRFRHPFKFSVSCACVDIRLLGNCSCQNFSLVFANVWTCLLVFSGFLVSALACSAAMWTLVLLLCLTLSCAFHTLNLLDSWLFRCISWAPLCFPGTLYYVSLTCASDETYFWTYDFLQELECVR